MEGYQDFIESSSKLLTLLDLLKGKTGKKRFLSLCGGTGRCGRCRVKIITEDRSDVMKPNLTEKQLLGATVDEGIRLACQFVPTKNLKVIPIDFQELQVSDFKIQDSYQNFRLIYPYNPRFETITINLTPATLETPLDDFTRLKRALLNRFPKITRLNIKKSTLNGLYDKTRRTQNAIRVILDKENQTIARIKPLDTSINERLLGVVVDIGTTSIVTTLIDLESGRIIGAKSVLNPQIEHGRDVMSRLSYALGSSSNRRELQQAILHEIRNLIDGMLRDSTLRNQTVSSIVELVVVGNSVMHHLFLCLPIDGLARAPYIPVITQGLSYTVGEIDEGNIMGLPNTSAISLPPLIGGFIGSDAVVDILYSDLPKRMGTHLLIDFGTNSEIILAKNGVIYAASVAAGGAFEGQHISCGMRGIIGAIESFWITNDTFHYLTIGSAPPRGICGSGIIDILASLRIHGFLDRRGRLFSRKGSVEKDLIIVPERSVNNPEHKAIILTREDIVEVQKAKAATFAAIRALTNEIDITISEIDTVSIAGVFGSKLNIENARIIGLLPNLPPTRFKAYGNAAERGGRTFLISLEAREASEIISRKVQRMELSTVTNFQEFFTEELFFPPLKENDLKTD
ncbi:MAG: ASKHA domain-containing protein [Candidatus Heimdallarchaeota archaeon]